jgi:hypothetical protein
MLLSWVSKKRVELCWEVGKLGRANNMIYDYGCLIFDADLKSPFVNPISLFITIHFYLNTKQVFLFLCEILDQFFLQQMAAFLIKYKITNR